MGLRNTNREVNRINPKTTMIKDLENLENWNMGPGVSGYLRRGVYKSGNRRIKKKSIIIILVKLLVDSGPIFKKQTPMRKPNV